MSGASRSDTRTDVSRFVGTFDGSAEVQLINGGREARDMSVVIALTRKGFNVTWSSVTHKSDGRRKTKTYSIDFVSSNHPGVFAAAMQVNLFGHAAPNDPLDGEPFVWASLHEDTLSVYSLFVNPDGGFEMQQFDRTLQDGGLKLDFLSIRNGEKMKTVSTFLTRR
ncbi:MAG: hypothetical protein CSA70_00295 [Rhodobacterales bacterium]|nr:MAG: hypothetical protein CSA70_00295 [Rhodobacterales bacterium]